MSATVDTDALCPECPQCGYDLTSLGPGRQCSECGLPIPAGSVVLWGRSGTETAIPAVHWIQMAMSFALIFSMTRFGAMAPVVIYGIGTPGIIALVVWRYRHSKSWRKRHVLFAHPLGVSVTRGRERPTFLKWTNFDTVRMRHQGRWTLSWTRPSRRGTWLLQIVSRRTLRDPITNAAVMASEHVTFIFDAPPQHASRVENAIRALWTRGLDAATTDDVTTPA